MKIESSTLDYYRLVWKKSNKDCDAYKGETFLTNLTKREAENVMNRQFETKIVDGHSEMFEPAKYLEIEFVVTTITIIKIK